MVHWDLPRTPASASLLADLGFERGVPEEMVLRGTGLRREHLDDPNGEVSAAQELRIIENLLDALGDPPGLGLAAGVRYHFTTYGIWGFALISSPTLRSAIATGLRYLDLTFAFCEIWADETGGSFRLVLDTPGIPARLRRFVIERDCAAIQTVQREVLAGALPIRQFSFAFPAPPALEAYHAVFDVETVFDASQTTALVDPAFLDQPLPQADVHASKLALAQCEELLTRRHVRAGVAGQVRSLLLARLSDPPDEVEVAATLHLSDRTLRHHLGMEGTSFRALREEVRERLAEELLVTGGLPVAEVARRLGYVEVSSFSQAFRRWKGIGPRAYLARLEARPAHPVDPALSPPVSPLPRSPSPTEPR
ncbi:MAG: AraC family transcriptional regulator [Nocardioides sp.]